MSYFIDGIDASQFMTTGNGVSVTQYTNFPKGFLDPSGNRGIAQCNNFGYLVNGIDVASQYKAIQVEISSSTDIDITTATYRKFKHVSSLIYAGGGGGGGGGGKGWTGGSRNDGSPGKIGGWGGYSYIRSIPISNYRLLRCVSGTGGTGGARGDDSTTPSQQSRPGQDGFPGNDGNGSVLGYFNIGGNIYSIIHTANGGGGGGGGPGGRSTTITYPGNAGNNSGESGSLGGSSENADTANNNSYLYRKGNADGTPGNGGPQQYAGNAGEPGYGWLWFLYQKN